MLTTFVLQIICKFDFYSRCYILSVYQTLNLIKQLKFLNNSFCKKIFKIKTFAAAVRAQSTQSLPDGPAVSQLRDAPRAGESQYQRIGGCIL